MLPYPGGLTRNVVQCLEDFKIPMLLEHIATFIHGADRVEAVTVTKVDEDQKPISGTERAIKCDALILSVGLIPENELSESSGIALDPATGGPVVDERMETSVKGMFACGNVVHVHDLVDHVTQIGEMAGESAARSVLNRLPPFRREITLKAGENVRYVVPQMISGERPVTLHLRVKKPMRNARVRIGNITTHKRVVKPPEMVVVKLGEEMLDGLEKVSQLVVNVREEDGREERDS